MLFFCTIFVPIFAALVSLCVGKRIHALEFVAVTASIVEFVASLFIAFSVVQYGTYDLQTYLSVDALSSIVMMLTGLLVLSVCLYSITYMRAELGKKIIRFDKIRLYYVLIHLFSAAMFLAAASASPVITWIAIEATTLSTAFLISFYNKRSAMEAAWKYLVINSVGLLLGFFGTLIFFTPLLGNEMQGITTWKDLVMLATKYDPTLIKIAFIFVMVGYGTKMGLVPMHTWRPDTYSKAPTPVVALFSGALLDVAFLTILKFKIIIDASVGGAFSGNLFIGFGLLSIVVSALIIYVQQNYKRLLAYSSIEHAGLMVLGLGFGGIGSFAAILHMIYHSIAKSVLFLGAGNIFLKYSSTKIKMIKNMASVIPVTSVIFFMGALAVTGVPPFGMFLTELYILSAGVSAHPVIALVTLIALVIVFAGFLRHLVAMVYSQTDGSVTDVKPGEAGVLTLVVPAVLICLLLVLSFYIPDSLNSLITTAVSQFK